MLRLALAIGLLLQRAPIDRSDYSITNVSTAISPNDELGPIGSGLMCVRVGKLEWWTLAKADPAAWLDAGQRAFADAGLATSLTDQSTNRYRVSLRIKALKLNLCLAWMGIGRKPRGKGTMTVEFVVRDAARNIDLPTQNIVVDVDLRGRDPRKDDSVLTHAVGDAVRKFIATQPTS